LIEYANSSLTKALELKSQVYAEANIVEYWVVNLKRMELVVFTNPAEGKYQQQQTLTRGYIQPIAFADTSLAVRHFIRR
jgi:Uma2 family endonuclease